VGLFIISLSKFALILDRQTRCLILKHLADLLRFTLETAIVDVILQMLSLKIGQDRREEGL
jgi:hypothetical protein